MGCNTKNYRRPCGLGPTLVSNNVVLMYPDVQQYLVSLKLREPKMSDIGFLCCCSSSSSASMKGTIRYLASGDVIRSYKAGTRAHMEEIIRYFAKLNCPCQEPMYTAHIFGIDIDMCKDCMITLKEMCYYKAIETPYCVTLHSSINELVVLSVCTGTVMRLSNESPSRWVDNMSDCDPPNSYNSILSEIARLVPFPDYINDETQDEYNKKVSC
jgi:hypothetical protein